MNENQKAEEPKKISVWESSAFLCITIGIPFCIFKFLFALLAVHISQKSNIPFLRIVGIIVIFWAIIDTLMNMAHIIYAFFKRKLNLQFCILAQLGKCFRRQTLFLAIDTFLSFSIICFVLWSGWIKELNQLESNFWYAATTINLLSLSLSTIWIEIKVNSDTEKMP